MATVAASESAAHVGGPADAAAEKSGVEASDGIVAICVAGGLGALVLAIADSARKGEDLLNMTTVMQNHNVPEPFAYILTIAIVVCLGAAMAWVYRPALRLDAFVRGLSVFAVLGISAPQPGPISRAGTNLLDPASESALIRQAPLAAATFVTFAQPQRTSQPGGVSVDVQIRGMGSGASALITLREASSNKVVGRQQIYQDHFHIERPGGPYVVEVEASGYHRVRFPLPSSGSWVLQVSPSNVPLAIQRLSAPQDVRLVRAAVSRSGDGMSKRRRLGASAA